MHARFGMRPLWDEERTVLATNSVLVPRVGEAVVISYSRARHIRSALVTKVYVARIAIACATISRIRVRVKGGAIPLVDVSAVEEQNGLRPGSFGAIGYAELNS